MSNAILIGILTGLVVIAFAAGAVVAYVLLRPRIITSPATGEPAGMDVDAAHSTVRHETPASETAHAPDRKAAFRMMAQWFAGKQCAICSRDIPALNHFGPEPGLLSGTASDPTTVAWTGVAPNQLAKMLETHQPVCSSCHLMIWFRHEHPDLVIDRHRTQETDTTVH